MNPPVEVKYNYCFEFKLVCGEMNFRKERINNY